jgi:glutamyl-tRNA synthetase
MTIEGLKQYMLMQGASQNNLLLEWDKIWALNKKIIDPNSPRYVALDKEKLTNIKIVDGPATPETKEIPVHKKNLELGNKSTYYSSNILLAHEDAKDLTVGEEVTLMDWGNAIVESVADNEITMKLHLEGDFKKTKKKLTWLSNDQQLTPVELLDYDYLITKKKLEEEDSVADFITPTTEFKVEAVADHNVAKLNAGDIIQLERKGYYIVDSAANGTTPARLIAIPDGKAKNTASKADDKADKKTEKAAPAANPNASAKKAAEKERKKLEKKLKKQAHKDAGKGGEEVQEVTEQLNEVKLDQ